MRFRSFRYFALTWGLPWLLAAAAPPGVLRDPQNESIANEVQVAEAKGLERLRLLQNSDGSWGSGGDSARITALALIACNTGSGSRESVEIAETREKGKAWLRRFLAGPAAELGTMELAGSCVALQGDGASEALRRRLRSQLVLRQIVDSRRFGYGGFAEQEKAGNGAGVVPLEDLGFIVLALAGADREPDGKEESNQKWRPDLVVKFIRSCAAKGASRSEHASKAVPGFSSLPMRGEKPTGSSMAAALFCLLQLREDPKTDAPPVDEVAGMLSWLGANFAQERTRNDPGRDEFELLLSMALDAGNVSKLKADDGRSIPWARVMAEELINRQNADGSWNPSRAAPGEKASAATTASTLLTLHFISRQL